MEFDTWSSSLEALTYLTEKKLVIYRKGLKEGSKTLAEVAPVLGTERSYGEGIPSPPHGILLEDFYKNSGSQDKIHECENAKSSGFPMDPTTAFDR